MGEPAPVRARVRMFQIGFGDCFLLTLEYDQALEDGRDKRHILFDFGSTKYHVKGFKLKKVADQIAAHCGPEGRLDVVVATHRHRDHVSGFGDAAASKVLDRLAPSLVVRSWTEHPDIDERAEAPPEDLGFVRALRAGQEVAARIQRMAPQLEARFGSDASGRALLDLAFDQISNPKAIERLDAWSDEGKKARYLHAGVESGIEAIVPGIKVHVLGPPTVTQHPAIARQVEDRPDYWLNIAGALVELDAVEPSISDATGLRPGPARALVERLQRQQMQLVGNIVRTLDDELNNTSLILLIEAGTKKLLFCGDAQGENWDFTLARPEDRALLSQVDLYKVGHHGSRNATPRALLELWNPEGTAQRRPVVSLLSTLPGFHGEVENESEVPRQPLVSALAEQTTLLRTDTLPANKKLIEVVGDLTDDSPFREV